MRIEFPPYNFPSRLYDFNLNKEIEFENYRLLEKHIQNLLTHKEINKIKDGLSNVLFWGFYRIGYRDNRVKIFRQQVTDFQLMAFSNLVKTNKINPISIKKLGLPQFSQFSFISKILMFINPKKYVTLDKKIMNLKDPFNPDSPLTRIPYSENDTGIRITKTTTKYYFEWCELCSFIAKEINNNKIAVDIERGFFRLVEEEKTNYGREIITSETKKLHALTANNTP